MVASSIKTSFLPLPGMESESCLVIRPHMHGQPISPAELLPLIQRAKSRIFVLSEAENLNAECIARSSTLIVTQRRFDMICHMEPSPTLCFNLTAFTRILGAQGEEKTTRDLIEEWMQRAAVLRNVISMTMLTPFPDQSCSQPTLPDESRSLSFETIGAFFSSTSIQANDWEPETVFIDGPRVSADIQNGIAALNAGDHAQALVLLKKVNDLVEVPNLFFVQAVAEIRSQLIRDAARSLCIHVDRHPEHEQGLKLLEEMRQFFQGSLPTV